MPEKVVRFPDPEEHSKNPDAHPLRDPCGATIIVMPTVRVERYEETDPPPARRRPF